MIETLSIAALVLSGVAIWLSVMFYKWSNEIQQQIKVDSELIKREVGALQPMFDALIEDHRETFRAIRSKALGATPLDEAAQTANTEFVATVDSILERVDKHDERLEELRPRIIEAGSTAVGQFGNLITRTWDISLFQMLLEEYREGARSATLPMPSFASNAASAALRSAKLITIGGILGQTAFFAEGADRELESLLVAFGGHVD
jgi:hypothetical protein